MGAIQPWDALIPNFSSLNPVIEASGQIDGKQYEIGLNWGYSAPLVRADMIDPNLDSYSYLFTDQAQGHISWFDTRWILQMAAISQGMDPGHSFDMTSTELEDAKNFCIDQYGRNVYNISVQLSGHVGRRAEGQRVGDLRLARDTYVALKDKVDMIYRAPERRHARLGRGARASGRTRPTTTTRTRSPTRGRPRRSGEKLISTWGYGHSNLDIDLSK